MREEEKGGKEFSTNGSHMYCGAAKPSQTLEPCQAAIPRPLLLFLWLGSLHLRSPPPTAKQHNPLPKSYAEKPNPAIRHNRQQFRVLKLLINVCVI